MKQFRGIEAMLEDIIFECVAFIAIFSLNRVISSSMCVFFRFTTCATFDVFLDLSHQVSFLISIFFFHFSFT